MKKLIALVLVICMSFGMIISTSAASPFVRKLNLVRLIRAMFASDDSEYEYGKVVDGVLTVYVDESGKKDADGTEKSPFSSISAARDAIRTIDKAGLDGIDVIVKSGTYELTEPIVFTAEDSGTKSCPIRYIGEDGANIVGGVSLTAKDFTKATGDALRYMPADVQDKIVQIDLTKYGISKEQIAIWLEENDYYAFAPMLIADGERQTLSRYPNTDYVNIEGGYFLDRWGNYTENDGNNGGEDYAVQTIIEYGEEHMSHTLAWHDLTDVFAFGRYSKLWCHDDTEVISFDTETDTMLVPFSGGYFPKAACLLYWYNIPEELDIPGEYYIDRDAILYYYPKDSFDTSTLSIPVSEGLVRLEEGTSSITFENLTLSTSLGNGIEGVKTTDGISVIDCTIYAIMGSGIIFDDGNYYNTTITGNYIHDLGRYGVRMGYSGDKATVSDGNTVIANNLIHDWSLTSHQYAISATGVGILISHNTCHDSIYKAITCSGGANVIIEYNHIYNVGLRTDDVGMISVGGFENGNITVRYNYVHDAGPVGAAAQIPALNPDYSFIGIAGIYYDSGSSYVTTYGNVIKGIRGNGFLTNAGRGNTFTGNLVVDCTGWYIWASDWAYHSNFNSDGSYKPGTKDLEDYVYTDAWKAVNPELSQLITDRTGADPDDPLVYSAPANIIIKNNWVHYNRSQNDHSNYGTAPYNIEEYTYVYTAEGNLDIKKGDRINDNVSVYNSRRQECDIKTLITETSGGILEITWEQFETIGVEADSWNLDIEIPALQTVYPKG